MTEQKYQELLENFFSGVNKKLALPRKIFHWTERRNGDANKKGQRSFSGMFCGAKDKEHHPGLEVSFSGGRKAQSPSCSSKMVICRSYSVGAQTPSALRTSLVPRKRSTSTRSASLATWAMAFPFTHPSLPCHVFPNDMTIFLSRQRALGFFSQLNRWEIYNSFSSVCHLPSVCGLQCWNFSNWFSLKVRFHFSL